MEPVDFVDQDLVDRVHLARPRRLRCGIPGQPARSLDRKGRPRRWRVVPFLAQGGDLYGRLR